MSQPCRSHRGVAVRPIHTADDAIRTLMLATDDGSTDCVVVACVDAARRPLTLFVFDRSPGVAQTPDPGGRASPDDDLEQAVEALLAASASADSPLSAVFLGSCRPDSEPGPTPEDELRWLRLADLCADAGIELLDWFLVTDGAVCSVAEGLRPGPGW